MYFHLASDRLVTATGSVCGTLRVRFGFRDAFIAEPCQGLRGRSSVRRQMGRERSLERLRILRSVGDLARQLAVAQLQLHPLTDCRSHESNGLIREALLGQPLGHE